MRGVINKMPYFKFSDYAAIPGQTSTFLTSTTQYAELMEQMFSFYPELRGNWTEDYAYKY